MKSFFSYIQNKAVLLGSVVIAAIVGGATTAVVLAAIPNSQTGQINGCYRNNGGVFNPQGSLRVIDSQAGQTCSGNETALNWDQSGWKGYGYITGSSSELDTSLSKNVTSATPFNDSSSGLSGFCIDTNVNIEQMSITSVYGYSQGYDPSAIVRNSGDDSISNSETLDRVCGTNINAAIVSGNGSNAFGGIYFFFR